MTSPAELAPVNAKKPIESYIIANRRVLGGYLRCWTRLMQGVWFAYSNDSCPAIYCSIVYCLLFRTKTLHTFRDVTIVDEVLKNLDHCLAMPFSKVGSLINCATLTTCTCMTQCFGVHDFIRRIQRRMKILTAKHAYMHFIWNQHIMFKIFISLSTLTPKPLTLPRLEHACQKTLYVFFKNDSLSNWDRWWNKSSLN